jgi:hypothetical protein
MAPAVETAQQKDNLCGPFWVARLLGADEDQIAARAGTILPDPDDGSVPPGAQSKKDYTVDLPTGPPQISGTSGEGLLDAIESQGVECIPICAPFDLAALLEAKGDGYLLANVRTGPLWSSKPPVVAVIAELAGEEADGGTHEWDVGHFVHLERLIGGRLVLVHDSYPTLGHNGRHLQPTRLVEAALRRGDGREGGVLAINPSNDLKQIANIGLWDNGTRR